MAMKPDARKIRALKSHLQGVCRDAHQNWKDIDTYYNLTFKLWATGLARPEYHSPRSRAIIDAAVSRLRPVAMAAATTILGMAPLFPDAFFVSMAVTIAFGLGFATVLTMVVVPVLYAIFYRAKVPGTLA